MTCGAWAPVTPYERGVRNLHTYGTGATQIIYPADVRDAKNRIDAKMTATARDVAACGKLSDADVKAWADFFLAWRKFFCGNDSGDCTSPDVPLLLGLGSMMDQCETWEAQLYDWQKKIAALCAVSTPATPPPTPTADKPGLFTSAGPSTTTLVLIGAGVGLAAAIALGRR
jgi:hypothetical protein